MMSPYKDCEKRELGCHDRCDDYAQFKIDREAEKKAEAKRQAEKKLEYYIPSNYYYALKRKTKGEKL